MERNGRKNIVASLLAFLLLCGIGATMSISVLPSNLTTDLYSNTSYPRYLLNGTEFPKLGTIKLAPLAGSIVDLSKSYFLVGTLSLLSQ